MPLGVAAAAAHICKDRVVDAVEVSPLAYCRVAFVAFDEAVLGPHAEGVVGEGLVGAELSDDVVCVVEQQAVGAEDQVFFQRFGVDGSA